jgi:lipid A 4'-phosphatase
MNKVVIGNNNFVNIIIAALTFLFFVLFFFPKIDINFSKLFYINGEFIYKKNCFAIFIFKSIPMLTKGFVAVIILIFFYSLLSVNFRLISISLFFLLSAAIAPGLLVNEVFKNHFGRSRPDNVKEFGGKHEFTKPLTISKSCKKNCSFSSGHASMGYYFTSLSYLFIKRNRTFKLTFSLFFLFGSLVGLIRIMQGRHFLSDVIFSASITLLTTHIISFFLLKYENKEINQQKLL